MLPIPLNNAIEMKALRQDSNAEASSDLGIKFPKREGTLNEGTLNFVIGPNRLVRPPTVNVRSDGCFFSYLVRKAITDA